MTSENAPNPAARALAYARPMARPGPPPPRPLPAVLSCLPGLVCWVVFLSFVLPAILGVGFSWRAEVFAVPLFPLFILGCWGLGIVTAIGSMVVYVPVKRKPWYVWLNLLINGLGLLFTAGVVVLIIVAMNQHDR
jgi:hypothetical protein